MDAHSHINWFGWTERHEFPPLGFALLNFGLLVWLLRKIAWPKIRDGARARHHRVARELGQAQQARANAEVRLSEYDRRLRSIDREIEGILAGVRQEAQADKERVLAAALAAAERMHREADFSIKQETKQLRLDVEREVARAATVAAEALLRKYLNSATDRALCDEFVARIGEARA